MKLNTFARLFAVSIVAFAVASCGSSSSGPATGGGGGGGNAGKKGVGGTPAPGLAFAPTPLSFAGGSAAIAFLDADGDGDLDMVLGNSKTDTGQANELYLNDGDGNFTKGVLPANSESTSVIAIADLNGDKSPDLVFGNGLFNDAQGGGTNYVCLNDGKGAFQATALPGTRDHTQAVVIGDVDQDGDLDIITGNGIPNVRGEANRLYVNNGSGEFALQGEIGSSLDATMALELADVNGDGNPDLIVGNHTTSSGNENRLLLGDGAGSFAAASGAFPGDPDLTLGIAIGDVDKDGDLDVLFANEGQDSLFLGDGAGAFADATSQLPPAENRITEAIAFFDYDEDGDLDIVTTYRERGQQNDTFGRSAWLGDGTGTFAPTTTPLFTDASFEGASLVVADVDGDRDPDVLFGSGSAVHYYRNGLRDLTSQVAPKLGATWDVLLKARPGLAPVGQLHVPYLALAALQPRVPLAQFGAWGLNPQAQLALPVVPMPSPEGAFVMQIPIPNDPLFDGRTLYAQSLVIHEVQNLDAWHLTNVVSAPATK